MYYNNNNNNNNNINVSKRKKSLNNIRLNLFIEQHLCQQLLLLQKVQRKNIFLNIYVDKHKTNCDILILAASMNWPLVGSIIGLVFLGALTLISYLCWRYCWFVSFEIMCYY
jgi:hypothetical protein